MSICFLEAVGATGADSLRGAGSPVSFSRPRRRTTPSRSTRSRPRSTPSPRTFSRSSFSSARASASSTRSTTRTSPHTACRSTCRCGDFRPGAPGVSPLTFFSDFSDHRIVPRVCHRHRREGAVVHPPLAPHGRRVHLHSVADCARGLPPRKPRQRRCVARSKGVAAGGQGEGGRDGRGPRA